MKYLYYFSYRSSEHARGTAKLMQLMQLRLGVAVVSPITPHFVFRKFQCQPWFGLQEEELEG